MERKRLIGLVLTLLIVVHAGAEIISLDSCRTLARKQYPLIQQVGLIEKTRQFSVEAAEKSWLPRVSVSVRATYQSDVTELPEALTKALSSQMGTPLEPFQKQDQYQAVVDVNQLIWDGGQVRAQKSAINASAEVEKQKTETDLYSLNERINNLYFGILLLNEQLNGLELLLEELKTNQKKAESLQANGVLLQADVDAVKVELISTKQRINENKSTKKSYCLVLSAFTGMTIDESTQLIMPQTEIPLRSENNRPELKLFTAQQLYFESQEKALYVSNLPKLGAFVQGGYGRPSLNMFNPSLAPYYIGGIRLSWDLSGFYTQRLQLDKLTISKKNVEVMRETFLFNNAIQRTQHQLEIEKIKENLKTDDELIALRSNIKRTAEAKMQNGTITVSDLLREINAEHLAHQQKKLHEIQLGMAIYQIKTDSNHY